MNWNKFLNLVKKTGDRLIVTDKDEGEAYVIMSLSEYEDMIGKLSGEVEKPEIAPLPHEQGLPEEFEQESEERGFVEPNLGERDISEEERFYLEPIE
ncbi:hypothetical protein GWN26_08050 [Candidatus Saccharibacteria bacterium]|nr:type II toxin-antitoxin system Phd/YefM family antitoxin [Candidatus Saccharibacteria bacterium]NIV03844.1 hypothetical protein [Calditrichia bacterium]NIS38403.1 type II toxin-antitoxin system Phd/YefM family antitoxin [Candidatus Saccharibacteria bacterium]NIV72179.1 hypothetical protein [Calditrichia bacterium]NIV99092.1 hypothetical protein [Candidatus Saccharibacteria bacterium]